MQYIAILDNSVELPLDDGDFWIKVLNKGEQKWTMVHQYPSNKNFQITVQYMYSRITSEIGRNDKYAIYSIRVMGARW